MSRKRRRWIAGGLAVGLALAAFGFVSAFANSGSSPGGNEPSTTPIKHLVVIFQENESFDHYFGTYPIAKNPGNEPAFTAAPGSPTVNGLSQQLLEANPNQFNPRRLSRGEAVTCDMDHGYTDEQKAYDAGLVDKFPEFTASHECEKGLVMDYYDGNTVTGLWNLAQHFALNDNSFGTQFGPSTPGAINLVSGETHGAVPASSPGLSENGTDIGDGDPKFDLCGKEALEMTGKNIGDLLNKNNVTWGWFQGGFAPTGESNGKPVCGSTHKNVANATVTDYSPHHNPFEYYKSTANPRHRAPESEALIGHSEPGQPEGGANHEYDISAFDEAVKHENLPAVSFVKAAEYQDGHPGYSDPLDEQAFIAEKLDELEHSNQWESTAVVIAYDDSDGWYDHVMPPIVSPSESASDALTAPGSCRPVADQENGTPLPAINSHCGFGPRQPLLVLSPYARQNYVDNTLTDQSSITRFIEENWQTGHTGETSMANKAGTLSNMFDFEAGAPKAPKVFLDPANGEITGEEGGKAGDEGDDEGGDHGHGHGSGDGDHGSGNSGGHGSKNHEKVHCAVNGHGRQVELNCSVGGGKGRGAVRFRIERGHKVFGTSRAAIKGAKASATVDTKGSLAGKYTLLATVSRTDGVDALSQSVSLPGKGSVNLH
ncbi:MAG TPA: alkaline phosphatase family protein [Solirubrobacterales bacterium]